MKLDDYEISYTQSEQARIANKSLERWTLNGVGITRYKNIQLKPNGFQKKYTNGTLKKNKVLKLQIHLRINIIYPASFSLEKLR